MIGYVISKQEKNFFKKIFNKLDIEEYENGKKYIIPKLNQKVIEKLKKDNISYSQFVHSCIYKYLNGELKLK